MNTLRIDVDQCRYFRSGCTGSWFVQSARFDMSAITRSEMISRRKALSLMGLAATFGLAAAPVVLTVSDAEAQTAGMERRQERRAGRHERREERRAARHERREERRTGTTTGAATTSAPRCIPRRCVSAVSWWWRWVDGWLCRRGRTPG